MNYVFGGKLLIMHYRFRRAVPVVGVASLIGVALLAQFVVDWITQLVGSSSGYPVWLPHFATAGQTIYVYSVLAAVVSYLIVPILIFSLGYYYGKHRV